MKREFSDEASLNTGFAKLKPKYQRAILELEADHNHSLYREICLRSKAWDSGIALEYKSSRFTYREMRENADVFARSLAAMGYEKGDQILVCMSNCPEFVFLFFAASKLGLVLNCFGDWFDSDYLEYIFEDAGEGRLFLTDDVYPRISGVIANSHIREVVVFSLADSLPKKEGEPYNPAEDHDYPFLDFRNHISEIRDSCRSTVLGLAEFVEVGDGDFPAHAAASPVFLNDGFTITYSSGTTNPLRPKAIQHAVRSYAVLARFKDPDVSGMGKMRNLRCLMHFPTYVHAGLSTALVDPLFQGCTVVLEPIYHRGHFLDTLLDDKPNFCCASVGFWMEAAKKLMFSDMYKDVQLPFLMIACVSGEGLSKGEERFLNHVSKVHRFGSSMLPWPLSPISFSIGGGTSETSGVFVTLFKSLQERNPIALLKGEGIGLTVLGCAQVGVLSDGQVRHDRGCEGELVISGPCNMMGYFYENALNDDVFLASSGIAWIRTGAKASLLDQSHLLIKGRLADIAAIGTHYEIPLHEFEDVVLNEASVMSCSAIMVENDEVVVLHIEQNPLIAVSSECLLSAIASRLNVRFVDDVCDQLFYRVRSLEESFPVAPSGKRDIKALKEEGTRYAVRHQDALSLGLAARRNERY